MVFTCLFSGEVIKMTVIMLNVYVLLDKTLHFGAER